MAVFVSKVCPKVESSGQTEKKNSIGATAEEIFKFNRRIDIKVMSSSFLRSTFRLTQTKKSGNGRMKYKF